ncbi:hypothetical protein SAMN05216389_10149 [Oceanobacillus limi]|uniref:Uncharacterized protein n=1 Tax=Oceanobacillus limi TaxID=930131 RepID=A0A1H9XZM7_9BACI|nr:hypothetical protein SAMN05216389_10149 [Oceanobacillus limi]
MEGGLGVDIIQLLGARHLMIVLGSWIPVGGSGRTVPTLPIDSIINKIYTKNKKKVLSSSNYSVPTTTAA